ncbi:MAG TPA: class II aldolase/adducin family protein [Xanthobacteraceae bacterium]|nr:class II aldolase/adducin family protein [Xanthobacteraceae bacterium]
MSVFQDLVIAYRVLAQHGVIDAYGHVSVRCPNNRERFWMARALAPELVTEADLMEFDLDSAPIDPRGRSPVIERFIHGQIYRARPEVNAVVHNHSPAVIPFSCTNTPLQPIFHMAAFIGLGVPNWEIRDAQKGTDMLVRDNALGASLARTLGPHPAALMRGHGAVVVGENLPRAVGRSVYLELNARLQFQAHVLAGGSGGVVFMDGAEVAANVSWQAYERFWTLCRMKVIKELEAEAAGRAAGAAAR